MGGVCYRLQIEWEESVTDYRYNGRSLLQTTDTMGGACYRLQIEWEAIGGVEKL